MIYGSDQAFSKSLFKLQTKFKKNIFKYDRVTCSILIHNCGGKHPKNQKSINNELIDVNYFEREDIKTSDVIIFGF